MFLLSWKDFVSGCAETQLPGYTVVNGTILQSLYYSLANFNTVL